MIKLRITLIFLVLGFASSCRHQAIVNLPTGVSNAQVNNWVNTTNSLKDVQSATHGVLTAAVDLNHSGVISNNDKYVAALGALGRANQIEVEFAQFLKTVPNDWSLPVKTKAAAYTQQILTQLGAANDSGVLNVKNPKTGQSLSDSIGAAIRVLKLILQLSTGTARLFMPREAYCV